MVFEKIRDYLEKAMLCTGDDITMDSEFGKDITIDSVDLVDLIITLEDEFGVSIDEEEVFNVKTIGDVVALVEERLKK